MKTSGPLETSRHIIWFEILLAGCSSAGWVAGILAALGWLPLAGQLSLGLYHFFSIAAVTGWVVGNLYVFRKRSYRSPRLRRRAALLYWLGPPSFLYVLRAMAPLIEQREAPLVPLLSFGVYSIFFLVPITLTPPPRQRLD